MYLRATIAVGISPVSSLCFLQLSLPMVTSSRLDQMAISIYSNITDFNLESEKTSVDLPPLPSCANGAEQSAKGTKLDCLQRRRRCTASKSISGPFPNTAWHFSHNARDGSFIMAEFRGLRGRGLEMATGKEGGFVKAQYLCLFLNKAVAMLSGIFISSADI